MTIIQTVAGSDGQRDRQFQSHRRVCWEEGYIAVPSHLESVVEASCGYCGLTIENGVLVGITPTERPEPEPVTPELTAQEAAMDMLTELDYRTSLLELGIKEV